ncbi:TPA: hypothetical protein EYN47_01200 [Candidatus Saccharibacteria bacterium]|nr:hypothetical protein [Candidatus Saccharibacteria bacterium]
MNLKHLYDLELDRMSGMSAEQASEYSQDTSDPLVHGIRRDALSAKIAQMEIAGFCYLAPDNN